MTKPYVICHMLTSINGKIDGTYMSDPNHQKARELYNQIRIDSQCDGVVYGQTTMKEVYARNELLLLDKVDPIKHDDYIACKDAEAYVISIDLKGTLAFENNYIQRKGRVTSHIIQIVGDQVSDAYLNYLQQKNISYLFSEKDMNCKLVLEKLVSYFNIKKVMIAGGGITNDTFLQQNMIDELSLVIAPVSESAAAATVFEGFNGSQTEAKSFKLLKAEVLDNNCIWLRYKTEK